MQIRQTPVPNPLGNVPEDQRNLDRSLPTATWELRFASLNERQRANDSVVRTKDWGTLGRGWGVESETQSNKQRYIS